jgi:hypothetical protein
LLVSMELAPITRERIKAWGNFIGCLNLAG